MTKSCTRYNILYCFNDHNWKLYCEDILDKYKALLLKSDLDKYSELDILEFRSPDIMNNSIISTLSDRTPLRIVKVLLQLKLANTKNCRIIVNGNCFVFKPEEKCTICNLQESDSFKHLLLNCPFYNPVRAHYFGKFINVISANDFISALSLLNVKECALATCNFISTCAKLRDFALDL